SANNVWAVGYAWGGSGASTATLTEHWNGTQWSVVPSPNVTTIDNYLHGVAVISANDVWAVGTSDDEGTNGFQTLVEHWNGTAWSVVSSPNPDLGNRLYGVAAVSANYVWAVGDYASGGIARTLVEHYTSPCVTPTSII